MTLQILALLAAVMYCFDWFGLVWLFGLFVLFCFVFQAVESNALVEDW